MEIIEFKKINCLQIEEKEACPLNGGCNDDCYSDDGGCPGFCDHEW